MNLTQLHALDQRATQGPWDYERDLNEHDLQRPWIGRLGEACFAAMSCGETKAEAEARLACRLLAER